MTEIPNSDIVTHTLKSCVYVPQYVFKKCRITTCKNFTEITDSSCLAIDRVQPIGNKIISDSELHLFKFNKDGVTSRLVAIKRKKAVFRVKAILVLSSFIEFIRDNYKPELADAFHGRYIERAELSYPLKIRKLGFQNWMWRYLVNPKVYEKFTKKKEGECSTFKIYMLIDMTAMKFNTLLSQIKPPKRKLNEYTSKTSTPNHPSRVGSVKVKFRMGKE